MNTLLQFAFDSASISLANKIRFKLRSLEKKLLTLSTKFFDIDQKFESILSQLALELISDNTFQNEIAKLKKTDDKIFMIISRLLYRIFLFYIDRIQQSNSLGFIKTIKEIVALLSSNLFVSLPYFVSYFQQTFDSLLVRDVQKAFNFDETEKLLLVTDTYFDINGVANTVRKMIQEAKRRSIDFTIVTCLNEVEKGQVC